MKAHLCRGKVWRHYPQAICSACPPTYDASHMDIPIQQIHPKCETCWHRKYHERTKLYWCGQTGDYLQDGWYCADHTALRGEEE